jgi:outer membrane autotransporter protein
MRMVRNILCACFLCIIADGAAAQPADGLLAGVTPPGFELMAGDEGALPDGSVKPAQLVSLDGWRTWDTVFAVRSSLSGDAKAGTQDVTASQTGMALGADRNIASFGLAGGSVSYGQQTFSSGSGHGRSHDLTLTLYGRYSALERVYLTGALSYGWHNIDTSRSIPAFPAISLAAAYQAQDVGGRLEGGYLFTQNEKVIFSPYLAFAGDAFHQPAYGETGLQFLAASFAAKTIDVTHVELGSRYVRFFSLDDGGSISLDALAGWEYELDDNPYVLAAFQTAPDAQFPVYGARPAKNTALLGAGLRLQTVMGISLGARGDARLGAGTTIASATADLTYQW